MDGSENAAISCPGGSRWRDELAALSAAGLQPRYPLAQWLRPGASVDLVAGLDFLVPPAAMRSQVLGWAKRKGVRVRTSVRGDVLRVLTLQSTAAEVSADG